MYNDIERCDNHIDLYATQGHLDEIFKGILYGYYYEYQQCDDKPNLKFTLFFVTPFDNVYAQKYGDCNRNYKRELGGFENNVLIEKYKETKNMQIIPLQYDDYYGGDKNGCIDKTRPTFMEAIKTNIYKDDRSFFEKLIYKKSPYQIKEILNHNMFYKVTFEVPFDAIANYVRVDKILVEGDTEKIKTLYKPSDRNIVDGLAKRLARARSIINEMDILIKDIRADPEKFKKDNTEFDWAEECRTKGGLNIEATEILFDKVKTDFKKMEQVLYGAMTWDIKREPEIVDTKCSHDLCIRKKSNDSKFCDKCIQLPTKQCNYCEVIIKCQTK